MSRPRRHAAELCVPTTANMPRSLRVWLDEEAHAHGVSRSVLISDALIAWARRHGYRQPRESRTISNDREAQAARQLFDRDAGRIE